MATKPELRRAVANGYIKASDYNYNVEQLNNYIENGVADNAINNYEADREYSKGQWVLANTSEGKGLYESQVGGNKGNSLLDTTYWKKLVLGGVLNLFDTTLKDHILTYEETKGLALQGTWVYKEALAGSRYGYPDFYNKCLEEYNSGEETTISYVDGGASFTARRNENGHIFYDISQKGVVDSLFQYYGYAWFYGIDTENERIFLPRNNYFAIKGSKNSVPVVGNGMTLGLTNGTYNAGITKLASGYATIYSGAFDVAVSDSGNTTGTNAQGTFGVTTDAEKSGIIAKTSDLLNLDETKLLYICVGNTTNYEGVSDVVSQGMEILEQVNLGLETKVDKDSMTEVQCVVETYQNGTSWYRVWSDGWVEQGGRTGSGTSATVTMLKSYSNTNYTVTSANYADTSTDTGGVGASAYISNLSTNSFRVSQNSVTQWYACGY